jgi:hypothetical protein
MGEGAMTKGSDMRDCDHRLGVRGLLMAEILGLTMARTAAGILDKHRDVLARIGSAPADLEPAAEILDSPEFQSDNAIFTAILDAANECLGRFDRRPADQRWCDALLQVLELADQAPAVGVSPPLQAHSALRWECTFDSLEVGMTIQSAVFEDEPPEYYEDDIAPETCDCERCETLTGAAS